jgi:hypothetical protein
MQKLRGGRCNKNGCGDVTSSDRTLSFPICVVAVAWSMWFVISAVLWSKVPNASFVLIRHASMLLKLSKVFFANRFFLLFHYHFPS